MCRWTAEGFPLLKPIWEVSLALLMFKTPSFIATTCQDNK